MIKNRKLLEEFDRKDRRKNRYSRQECLKIFEALWREACNLGILPQDDILEGLDAQFRIARAVNYRKIKNV